MHRALAPDGIAVHNLHLDPSAPPANVETKIFDMASTAYSDIFAETCSVPVDYQGNTILASSPTANGPLRGGSAEELIVAARRESEQRGLSFDGGMRLQRAEPVGGTTPFTMR